MTYEIISKILTQDRVLDIALAELREKKEREKDQKRKLLSIYLTSLNERVEAVLEEGR